MGNLLWKKGKKTTLNLVSTPFSSEEEFEKTVFGIKEILGEVFPLKRQIRGGKKGGIPDIVGIDNDGNVCIIEMKNTKVDSSIIPQVLEYAIWADENPDSIKNMWLESPEQPEDIEINWDDYQVRILIVAPSFDHSALRAHKMGYPVSLLQVERWKEAQNEFILVNEHEEEKPSKITPVKGLEVYDQDFYERDHNKESVKEFIRYSKETERLVRSKNWSLDLKYNKYYCGYKHGFFNAFGIQWWSSKTFGFFFKLPKKVAEKIQPAGVKMDVYSERWKEAQYKITPGKTNVKSFLPLFKKSYEYLIGKT